ncbi:MAG: hypothetical protein IKG21_11875 [Atopobiaceae bacterium]|nr:hypothetical protein [Atopobiaceae bacterium]
MNKFLRSPKATIVLFALAVILIGFGGINAIQAAPRIESLTFRAQVQLTNVNVAVVENGSIVEGEGELLTDLAKSGDFQVGKTYDEKLSARNTQHPSSTNEGEGIPEYVRVSVYRYWTDENGKAVDLDPSYIKLNFVTNTGWTIDEEASTPERTVLYYKDIVPVDGDTNLFADKLTIDSAVATAISNGKYQYDNVNFHIKVTADAVQTHNGTEAMTSAWGRTNE